MKPSCLAVLLAAVALASCSSGATGSRDAEVAAPLDWSTWDTRDARVETVAVPDADVPGDAEVAPAEPAEPPSPAEVVEAVEAPPEPAPEPTEVTQPERDPEPLPEPVDVVEATPDPGPESTDPACATVDDCLALQHPSCPGWWACDGACAWQCPAPLDLYDLGDLEGDQQLFAEVTSESDEVSDGHLFRVKELQFRSFEWVSGAKTTVSIHGFCATPQAGAPVKPGVVLLAGLEGVAAASDAMDLAARVDAVVLVLDGPGQGGSLGTGPADGLGVLFATQPDPRATWFVAYAVAASRGLTWLKTQPVVQPGHLGVVGRRLGGVVALLVNGIDRRVRAAVALEAAGGIALAAQQGGWFKATLAKIGLAPYDATLALWASRADPLAYAAFQRGPVLLAVGAQDEYFPLPSTLATYAALSAYKRLALIADWDALWYAGATGQQSSYDNSARATQVLGDATTAWLRYHLAADPAYAVPAQPAVARDDDGLTSTFYASCASGADDATARIVTSRDGAFTFPALTAQPTGPGTWSVAYDLPPSAANDSNLVYFSEVTVPIGPAGGGQTLTLTSVPRTYPTFVPIIRTQL